MKLQQFLPVLMICFLFSGALSAQETKIVQKPANAIQKPPHRIIFQITTDDTTAHKVLMKQMGNVIKTAPGTQIEVVCHGPGLDMLVKEKSVVADKIKKYKDEGVTFIACEYAMKERKVEHSQVLPEAGFVEAGIIEIVTKQEQGWSYIKGGF